MAVVKADAYGHGAGAVARACLDAGATWLGVALVEEGLGLRADGIEAPILVLSEFPAGFGARRPRGRPDAGRSTRPRDWSGSRLPRTPASSIEVHVKVDTGMHRVGVWPPEDAPAFVERSPGLGSDSGASGRTSRGPRTIRRPRRSSSISSATSWMPFGPPGTIRASCTRRTRGRDPAPRGTARPGPRGHRDLRHRTRPRGRRSLGLRPALTWRSTVTMVEAAAGGRAPQLRAPLRAERGRVGRDRAGRLRGRLPSAAVSTPTS